MKFGRLFLAGLALVVVSVAVGFSPPTAAPAEAASTFINPLPGSVSTQSYACKDCVRDRDGNILIYGYHTGIDLAGGTTVVAPADGIVLFKQTGCKNQGEIGYDKTCGSGYGNYVDIEFTMADNSKRYGRFGHLSNNDAAPSSGCVKQGAALGPAGKTGNVTGVHLHWAMRSNTSNWTGYTTAHPDGYGFSNPTSYYSQSFKTCGGGGGSDGDGDGIPDASDRCASLRGFALWKGCRPNGLRNGSLEEGSTAGWAKLGTGTNIASYTDRATARDGDRYGATNVAVADGSIYQDVAIAAKPGESYTLSVWLRARHAAPMRGKLVLWATGGGTSVNEVETFSLTQDWQLVSVTFDSTVTRSQLRAQIYMSDTANTLYFDGATLIPNGLRNGSLEEGSTAGWAKLGTGTNIASYTDRATARDGDRYGATNVAVADGSIYQDVAIAAKPGESYTLSVWLRARHAAPMRGKLVLWATGGGTSVNEVETFSLTQDWQLVSVTFDSTVTRSQLRAQIYMSDTNATNTLYFDGATLSQGSRRVTIPGAVAGLSATPTATRANVSWSVPPVSGGSEVIDYAVTLSPGGLAKTTTNTSTAFTGLTASTPYAVSVRARNAVGFGPAVTFQLRTADAGPVPAGSFGALTPGRLLETRVGPNWETVDGQFQGVGRASAGQVTEVVVADRGGVPADAGAVAVNLTVINPSARGYATLWPCGVDQPTTSSLNYMAGQTVANSAIVKVGTGGKLCVYTSRATDLVIDTTGHLD